MRAARLCLALLMLCALPAAAGSITHVDPERFPATEMEMLITVHGHDIAGHRTYAIYDGPAGHFEVQTQGGQSTHQYVWLPGEIGRTPGVYSIVLEAYNIPMTGSTPVFAGRSGPGYFEVLGSAPPPPNSRPPIIQTSGDITAEATGPAGAVVNFQVSVSSVLDPNLQASCTSQPNTLFAIGRTPVTCTASDSFGTAMVTFNITVQDTTPPALQLPADITSSTPVVTYTVTATDLVDTTPNVACSPTSGSTFPNGATTVTCTASDDALNTASGTFQVTVSVTGPTLNVPTDMVVEATSLDGAPVSFVVTSSDGSPVTCSPASGSLFPFGTTMVSCTSGTAQGGFHVTVRDPMAPTVDSISATPNVLWPPNSKMEPITVTVEAHDLPATVTTARIVDVTANEDITDDWRITGPLTAELRAERLGDLQERVYSIVVEVIDHAGNVTQARVEVRVAHVITRSIRRK